MSSPNTQQAQAQARTQLPDLLARLNRALLSPYTTPSQADTLQAYIRNHILTGLAIATLPAPNIRGPLSLDRTARRLTRSFFAMGRARELGWLCRDLESEEVGIVWTARERQVWALVRKVVERMLILPGEAAAGDGSREALVRTLRGWREDEGWQVRTVDDVVTDGEGRRHVVGREVIEEVLCGRVFDWPLLLPPAPASVRTLPEQARVWRWPALRTTTNTAQLDGKKRQRADRALALMDGTAKNQRWARGVGMAARLRGSNGDVEDDTAEADEGQLDAAIRASLKTAAEEDKQRELEVIFVEKAEMRILREEEKRRYQALGFVEDNDEESEDDFGFDGEVEGSVGGVDDGVGSQGEAAGNGAGAQGFPHRHVGTQWCESAAALSSQAAAADDYPCAMCSQSFRDAFALNEHYQQHFDDSKEERYENAKA